MIVRNNGLSCKLSLSTRADFLPHRKVVQAHTAVVLHCIHSTASFIAFTRLLVVLHSQRCCLYCCHVHFKPCLLQVAAPLRASSRSVVASSPPLPVAWPTLPTPTSCGLRPASQAWRRQLPSPRPSTKSSPGSCWPTTAHQASTGRRSSMTRPLPSSRRHWELWATSSRYEFMVVFL